MIPLLIYPAVIPSRQRGLEQIGPGIAINRKSSTLSFDLHWTLNKAANLRSKASSRRFLVRVSVDKTHTC